MKLTRLILLPVLALAACTTATRNGQSPYAAKADSILRLMTLEEKVGQMNQYSGDAKATGPVVRDTAKLTQVREGGIGSMLNVVGAEQTRRYQQEAMQSRMRIPLIFGLDVIHGFRTVSPVPLGEAASFDLEAIELSARMAATEAAASGIHWTFAPMVDICRDARWGRIMEGAGEDPFYGSLVARARVRGFQGTDLSDTTTILACAKHFAAYGAPEAGKDYNSVDMSMGEFANFYMPPYKAAAEAGAATFMNAFNDFNNIPCTGNELLLRTLLKGEWGFKGFVVSDWGSVGEMVDHRYAADKADAAAKAVRAGCDMDMESRCYTQNLAQLVRGGRVDEKLVDDAVRRILIKKFELGLFADPFRYCDTEREKRTILSTQLRDASRGMAEKSIVLLRNQGGVLPFGPQVKSVALIGALAESKQDMIGFWANEGVADEVATIREALQARGIRVNYAEGYDLQTKEVTNLGAALAAARASDAVIIAVGERGNESGEAKSRGGIEVHAGQQELVAALAATGKPAVTLVMGGRPLIFNRIGETSPAILFCWWLGTEAGPAICNVLWGDHNPSARLPVTFPSHLAQVPIHYNYKSTGRPEKPSRGYTTSYMDIDYQPAYCFGYGLSYTSFDYTGLEVSTESLAPDQIARACITVTNSGARDGEEIVQLYIKDMVASVTRPIKEMKGFQKISLKKGESRTVEFPLTAAELGFYDNGMKFVVEPGAFMVMVGGNSRDVISTTFDYKP